MKTTIIIPTLNRPTEVETTLNFLLQSDNLPNQVIIIDQSDSTKTKELVEKETYKDLHVLYISSEIKSSALARNIGIEKRNKDSDIIIFLDDDVQVEENFISQIKNFFKENKQAKGGVANIETPSRKTTLSKKIWLFLLTGKVNTTKFFVSKGGFNALPMKVGEKVKVAERTSGCWMFFYKSVFEQGFRFEKQFMKYSLMEDCFLSYEIQKKYPNSLFFVPNIKMVHCETPTARIANKQKIYQNIIHRYYFIKKFNKSFFCYSWTMFVFSIFDLLQYKSRKILQYYYEWIKYVLQHKKDIWEEKFNFNSFIFWEDFDKS